MQRISLYVFLLLFSLAVRAQQNQAYLDYIAQYRAAAEEQQQKYKIPACITLAQGLLESGAGHSTLATEANNHFGVKCHNDWQGETFLKDDDQAQECFRKYASPDESFEDHSRFLLRPRYASLFELPITDYEGWAHGLKRCGYATDPGYAAKLIRIIEEYHLAGEVEQAPVAEPAAPAQPAVEVDTALTVTPPSAPVYSMGVVDLFATHHVIRSGLVRYVIAEQGDTYAMLADEFTMSESTLRRYNHATGGQGIEKGQVIYLTRH